MPGTPPLIPGDKGTFRQAAHTVTMREGINEIDPLQAAVRPDGAGEEIVDAGEVLIQQRDEIVLEY